MINFNKNFRGMMDSDGNHFVGYFSPTDVALEQKLLDDSEQELLKCNSYKDGFA